MFCPLNLHSDFSILESLPKPKQIVEKLKKDGYKAAALTDRNSMAGLISFYQECKKANIKPILGLELSIVENAQDKKSTNEGEIILLCKNLNGWKTLLKIFARANQSDVFFGSPRLDLQILREYSTRDLFCIFSKLSQLDSLKDTFGSDNIFERKLIYCPDIRYLDKKDKSDLDILSCVKLKTDIKLLSKTLNSGYHFPLNEEIDDIPENNYLRTQDIALEVEDFNILSKFKVPVFDSTKDSNEYLRQLSREGWNKKIKDIIPKEEQPKYVDRIKYELEILCGAGLADQFLIVQDYVNWAKSQGQIVGPGRGSVGGSLTAYLLNITEVDPIKFDLLFERFYSVARSETNSIADIDVDFPVKFRQQVIEYLKRKYNEDYVGHIATYSRIMGRGALKEVLRINKACSFDQMNRICEHIPDEASISDELQHMKEEGEESSIILWTLQHKRKELSEWCELKDDIFSGDFAPYFEQAIRLEGVIKAQSKHASGLIISNRPLVEDFPLVSDKSGKELMVGLTMGDAEAAGALKYDLLGLAALDKLMISQKLIKERICGLTNISTC